MLYFSTLLLVASTRRYLELRPVDLVHQIMRWYAYLVQDPIERIVVSASRHSNTLIG
jgi:hypothetical protein